MGPKEISISSHYEPSINGLRAIAIILVMSYHAFPLNFKGGFIGVDIFFVISGYLITKIVITEAMDSDFSLLHFYDRRIRRIFPALFLVLITVWCFGYWRLPSTDFAALGKHIAFGSGFLANFGYWAESGYFDTNSDLKPLLHLWSLGVEEQFYIFWPVALWYVHKKDLNLFSFCLLMLFVSFVFNITKHYIF